MRNQNGAGHESGTIFGVLLCTDEPLLALGLKHILSPEKQYKLDCVCGGHSLSLESLRRRQPDILILDCDAAVSLSRLIQIREQAPVCRIVLWVRAISTELAYQAIEHGVRAIVRSKAAPNDLLSCLEAVCDGRLWFDEPLKTSVGGVSSINLTKREGQLVEMLSQGMKNREIASLLDLSQGTVKVYLSKMIRKLGVKDRFELSLYGLRNMAQGEPFPVPVGEPRSDVRREPRAFGPYLRSLALPGPIREARHPCASAFWKSSGAPPRQTPPKFSS